MTEAKCLADSEVDISPLSGKRIAIVGYGSQGRAQALNLRDSGYHPTIGIRKGKSYERAIADGFSPTSVEDATSESNLIVVLTPDETQPLLLKKSVLPYLREGSFVCFATGLNLYFGRLSLPEHLNVFMVAPKGPGHILRERFLQGSGIPAIVAAYREDEESLKVALAYSKAIGCTRVGVIVSTVREEAIADLFGEQCVLAGGLVELMKNAFEVLVERGYTPEIAFIECILEVEYMASLIAHTGIKHLRDRISSTAFFGGATRGSKIVDEKTKKRMFSVLDEIENGKFIGEFLEYVNGKFPMVDYSGKYLDLIDTARQALRLSQGGD